MKTILVVGGAGYIGSHMVKMLLESNYKVVTLGNLSGGYRNVVVGGEFEYIDLADKAELERVFKKYQFTAVMHFASYIQVGKSLIKPAMYYENNVVNTLNLLDVMVKHDVKTFIFSSTAALFGEPEYTPSDEKHPTNPINPYGRSKLMIEQLLKDYDKAYNVKSICLRYFNAAGADPEGLLGERHEPETHLIPLILQAASKRRESISVFGRDYETADGTCIRDYIHIIDLCSAHLLALEKLINEKKSYAYNLGNGNGFSVQEVIDVARKVTGKDIQVVDEFRREGDPAVLPADASLAKTEFGWKPQYSELSIIIEHTWKWELNHYG
jgi:UDP-glucose 4-epimerase